MSYWSKLSMKDRADVMKLFLDKGISDLDTMRREYNIFAGGGNKNSSPRRTVYKAKYTGKVYDTAREAALDNRAYLNDVSYRYIVKSEKVKTPKEYAIPFINSKKKTLTNAGLATGAVISENMLDSIGKYAKQAGLPIKTALGLAVKESTLGNPTDDTSVYKILNPTTAKAFKEAGTGQHINTGRSIYPTNLVNFHADEYNPYDAALKYATNKARGKGYKVDYNKRDDLLIEGENYADSKVKEYEEKYGNNNKLENAFTYFKEHPDKYNPGQPNYQQLVNKRANEVWASPEVQEWYRNSIYNGYGLGGNLFDDGGKIHIKPSHRERLTELKKRTKKSEAELYKTGGPAVRKMITFARNARKWKHGLGGLLEI